MFIPPVLPTTQHVEVPRHLNRAVGIAGVDHFRLQFQRTRGSGGDLAHVDQDELLGDHAFQDLQVGRALHTAVAGQVLDPASYVADAIVVDEGVAVAGYGRLACNGFEAAGVEAQHRAADCGVADHGDQELLGGGGRVGLCEGTRVVGRVGDGWVLRWLGLAAAHSILIQLEYVRHSRTIETTKTNESVAGEHEQSAIHCPYLVVMPLAQVLPVGQQVFRREAFDGFVLDDDVDGAVEHDVHFYLIIGVGLPGSLVLDVLHHPFALLIVFVVFLGQQLQTAKDFLLLVLLYPNGLPIAGDVQPNFVLAFVLHGQALLVYSYYLLLHFEGLYYHVVCVERGKDSFRLLEGAIFYIVVQAVLDSCICHLTLNFAFQLY